MLDWLLREFRLLVNESIRIALKEDIRSRARLVRAAYKGLSATHVVYKQYIPSAYEVALSVLKVHRRRLKRGKRSSTPYIRKLMLKAENQSYRLDPKTGRLRIPIRAMEAVQLHLPLSEWHQSFLSDPSWGLGSLTVVPRKIILVVRSGAPRPYEPEAAIALDTNEDSLDGVVASGRADGPDGPPFRRRPSSPGDPLPATKEACEEKGWGPKGHVSFVESGRPTGAASDPPATAPNLETTRAVR